MLPCPRALATLQGAAQAADQTVGNGQAEAGTAILTGHRAVRLDESLEDAVELVLRDADSAVADRHFQAVTAGRQDLEAAQRDADPPGCGEFDRVAQEVGDDLPQANRIADDERRQFVWQLQVKG